MTKHQIVFENMEKAKAWSDFAETKAIQAITTSNGYALFWLKEFSSLKGHARFFIRASDD